MQDNTTPLGEPVSEINNMIDELDKQRSETLIMAKSLQQTKDTQLQTELQRLATKYGPDHFRVQDAAMRIAYNKKMFDAVDTQIGMIKMQKKDFDPTSWRVQGVVSDSNNKPLPNCTVSLAQKNAENSKAVCSSQTNDIGFYIITLGSETLATLKQTNLFISVEDNKNKLLQTDSTALTPTAGLIDTKNMIISDSASC